MRFLLTTLLLVGFVFAQGHSEGEKVPYKVKVKGKKPLRVTIHPKCMVCFGLSDKDTLWMQEIHIKTGAKLYFDGTLHAFLFYFYPDKYSRGMLSKDDITEFIVRDYATGKKIPADSAVYLVDSKLMGPNGLDLVPLNRKDAKKFKKKFGGEIVNFSKITADFITEYSKRNKEEKAESKDASKEK